MQNKIKEKESVFKQFTGKYALSKTLRFELVPYEEDKGKSRTRENLKNMAGTTVDGIITNFLYDQEIEDAYQILKPVFDKIHEEFITNSLESGIVKNLNFNDYFNLYKKYKTEQDKEEKEKIENLFDNKEKEARKAFAQVYYTEGERFKKLVGKDDGKEILKKEGCKVLTEAGILKYIKDNIEKFSSLNLKTREGKVVFKSDLERVLGTKENKGIFEGFFTYFSGFNQNKENYYSIDDKSTAVATRVVNENLPKFCDNILIFENKKTEYLKVYEYLKEKHNALKGKNQKGEEKDLLQISSDIFQINYFNKCLSQKEIEDYNLKIGDANFLINLYNQAKAEEEKYLPKNKKTFKRLLQFKTLYKQIGCGDKGEFIPSIKSSEELKHILKTFLKDAETYFKKINDFCDYLKTHESFENIYWSEKAINTISLKYFANWYTLKTDIWGKRDRKGNLKEEEVKIPQAVELKEIFEVLDKTENWTDKGVLFKDALFEKRNEKKTEIIKNSSKPSIALLCMIFVDIKNNQESFSSLKDKILEKTDEKNDENKQNIKQWLDSLLFTNQIVKYWKVKDRFSTESNLDEQLKSILFSENNPTRFYDVVRNYLTKKPQSEVNKLKLNFEKPNLLGGFVESKTENSNAGTQYGGYIFRKKDNGQYSYYLGVSKEVRLFSFFKDGDGNLEEKIIAKDDESEFERMTYYQVKTTSIYGTSYRGNYKEDKNNLISLINTYVAESGNEQLKSILKKESEKKQPKINTPKGYLNFLKVKNEKIYNDLINSADFVKLTNTVINNLKETLKGYTNRVPMIQSIIDKIEKNKSITLSDIQNDIENLSNEKTFIYKAVSKKEFSEVMQEYKNDKKLKTLYLFEIKISDKKLLSKYFLKLLSGNQNIFDLGKGELFYRKQIILDKDRKVKKGYENKSWVIENKRFTEEKFLLYLSILVNYKKDKWKDSNKELNDKLSNNKDICFLGIDRGEKHLAYYYLINKEGKTLNHGTLNMPFLNSKGNQRSVKAEKYFEDDKKIKFDGSVEWKPRIVECWNYNDLLDARASNRDLARKNWQTIGTIKELKNGYISQVVRKVVDIAIKNNAFVVLENLDVGFKRGRQKIEKSVYQKLELALAKKLNFYVDKNVEEGEVGSVTKALQLTPLVNNFGDMEGRSQFGIMLYARADYTSQTDPATGWRKSIYLKKGSEDSIKSQILFKFKEIEFDGKDYCFSYTDERTGNPWRLYSGKDGKSLDRFYRQKLAKDGQWKPVPMNLVEMLNGIFEGFDKNRSIYSQLEEGTKPKKIDAEHTAWESLRFTIDLIQQIRNTGNTPEDDDFIFSPVRNEKEEHFDSRKAGDAMPNSGDANGAYNIARKGIVMNEHIKRGFKKLYIRDEEWDAWLAGKDIWEKWLVENAEKLK